MSRRRMMMATIALYVPPVSTYYRPSSDVSSSGSFSITGAGTRYGALNESAPNDSSYVYGTDPGANNFVVRLTGGAISTTGGAILRYRVQRGGGFSINCTVSINGTVYSSITLPSAYTTYTVTLTKAQADALVGGNIDVTFAFANRNLTSWLEIEFLPE